MFFCPEPGAVGVSLARSLKHNATKSASENQKAKRMWKINAPGQVPSNYLPV